MAERKQCEHEWDTGGLTHLCRYKVGHKCPHACRYCCGYHRCDETDPLRRSRGAELDAER